MHVAEHRGYCRTEVFFGLIQVQNVGLGHHCGQGLCGLAQAHVTAILAVCTVANVGLVLDVVQGWGLRGKLLEWGWLWEYYL